MQTENAVSHVYAKQCLGHSQAVSMLLHLTDNVYKQNVQTQLDRCTYEELDEQRTMGTTGPP